MKKRLFIALVVLAITAGTLVQSTLAEDANTITVTGTAKVECKPDIGFITLYVKGDGILMVDAIKKAQEKADDIQRKIGEKHKGVKSIEVVDLELGQKKKRFYSSEQKDEPARPEVIKRMQITITPVPSLAHEIVDTAIRAGAIMEIPSDAYYPGQIRSVVVYGISDASKQEDEVKRKALDDARSKAKQMAELIGRKIGGVSSVGCSTSWPTSVYIQSRERKFPVKHTGIDPNKIEISQSLTITFELLDK